MKANGAHNFASKIFFIKILYLLIHYESMNANHLSTKGDFVLNFKAQISKIYTVFPLPSLPLDSKVRVISGIKTHCFDIQGLSSSKIHHSQKERFSPNSVSFKIVPVNLCLSKRKLPSSLWTLMLII